MANKIKIPWDLPHGPFARSLGETGSKELLGGGFMHKPKSGPDHVDYDPKCYSLCYLISGAGRYVAASGQEWELRPGDYFQRIPGHVHTTTIASGGGWRECFIDFGPQLTRVLIRMRIVEPARPVGRVGLAQGWVDAYAEIVCDLRRVPEQDLPALLPRMLELQQGLFTKARAQTGGRARKMVEQACLRLRERLGERIGLREFCAENAWSYETLRKAFREALGLSPKQYRIRCRIDAARHLLVARRDLHIGEVGYRLGYANPYEFSAQFKAIAGLTPSQYRERSGAR